MPYDSHMKSGKMKSGMKGYSHGMKSGKMGYGHGMDQMKPGYSTDSYRYSSPAARPGSNRHGFSRNPKQDSPGRTTSDPFPRPYDSVGPMPGPRTRRGRG